MNADEQVAVCPAEGRPAGEINEGVGRAREHDGEPTSQQLGPEQLADAERDVLFGQAAGEMKTGISGIDTTVPGIDDNRVGKP